MNSEGKGTRVEFSLSVAELALLQEQGFIGPYDLLGPEEVDLALARRLIARAAAGILPAVG